MEKKFTLTATDTTLDVKVEGDLSSRHIISACITAAVNEAVKSGIPPEFLCKLVNECYPNIEKLTVMVKAMEIIKSKMAGRH